MNQIKFLTFKSVLLFTCTIFLFSGCGRDNQRKPAGESIALGSQAFSRLGGGNLEVGGGTLSGTGSVVAVTSMRNVEEDTSYNLNFSLKDGGSLTLISHSNSSLGSGFEMKFRRIGSGPGSLRVTVTASGNSKDTRNAMGVDVFGGIDASRPLKVQLDIHNRENPSHVLLWTMPLTAIFSEESALFNTGDEIDKSNGSPGKGKGFHWGLVLDRAIVGAADRSEAKLQH